MDNLDHLNASHSLYFISTQFVAKVTVFYLDEEKFYNSIINSLSPLMLNFREIDDLED